MNKKSLVTIQILDLFGSPISKAQYEVKNQRTGQVIAAGATNSSGCIVEISRDKGTALDVYIKSMFNGLMVKVQTFVMSRDRMLVKIISPKVMLDLKTLTTQGNNGQYKRKTHIVKKGETLFEIAQKNHTTVRALERLNKIDDPNKISIGQVIKLPVNIPATGNNLHQEKSKPATQQRTKPLATTKPKPSQTPPVRPSNTAPQKKQEKGIFGANFGSKILDQVNELYEEGKKTLSEATNAASKILTVDDRSQDGGTPKVDAPNLCKTNPQCISSGKSELIREVNIRLAGFGGALPTDEFTELTATCIKQFQRDYMGVPETGKICGSVLAALDEFNHKYPIQKYMQSIACPCAKFGGGVQCKGFGASRKKQYKILGVEAPGMHRSTMWILKAAHFYLEKEKDLGVKITGISSGYRCIENNAGHNSSRQSRQTVNHMSGAALDVLISDSTKLNLVREKIFMKYMNAAPTGTRGGNRIFLESRGQGATGWIHFDILWYENLSIEDSAYYGTKVEKIINGTLSELCKKSRINILTCSGKILNSSIPVSNNNKSIVELVKELGEAIASGEGSYEAWNAGAPEGKRVKFGKMNDRTGTITGKTINQLLDASKNYTWEDERRRFATGKYQTIPKTLSAAKTALGLSGEELYDSDMQEKIFREYLLLNRRSIKALIENGSATVDQAMTDASKEWASIALPKGEKNKLGTVSDGTIGYHQSATNKANSHSTAKVRTIFEKIKTVHLSK
ncbi:LysM peptidoglycan-binding domain-containing protein [Acinetobacter radioresistens]|uniref:LysM peptidoglycan-binding domain-containing protein n=1 Tax=Acinetobacter radioresistens TaxID=40216 RepID=UPI0020034C18|nr:LysM peptidoglycan-binding domain-containing protein [Acinetobacter radioresistens]MCK4090051.1 LysM peptidoglycan-binding domain-containing protein [Acinetobacter radioresistens]